VTKKDVFVNIAYFAPFFPHLPQRKSTMSDETSMIRILLKIHLAVSVITFSIHVWNHWYCPVLLLFNKGPVVVYVMAEWLKTPLEDLVWDRIRCTMCIILYYPTITVTILAISWLAIATIKMSLYRPIDDTVLSLVALCVITFIIKLFVVPLTDCKPPLPCHKIYSNSSTFIVTRGIYNSFHCVTDFTESGEPKDRMYIYSHFTKANGPDKFSTSCSMVHHFEYTSTGSIFMNTDDTYTYQNGIVKKEIFKDTCPRGLVMFTPNCNAGLSLKNANWETCQ
jgi:hypothetical protein